MSDNEGAKAGKGWTDRQRLAYYFNLVEFSNAKLDFTNAPRPEGKSVGACRIMVDRLKGTLKSELAALRGGNGSSEDGGSATTTTTTTTKNKPATPKKAVTPRKRKNKNVDDDEVRATPRKRSRKNK
ncbi:uncharacterized protein SETTUDRAFT_54109, partial [Exserohilum turcica Et28A]